MQRKKTAPVAVDTKLLRDAMRAAASDDKNKVAAEAVEFYLRVKRDENHSKSPRKPRKMRSTRI